MAKTALKVVSESSERPNSDHVIVYGSHGIGIRFTDDPAEVGGNMREAGFAADLVTAARDLSRFVNQGGMHQPMTANALVGIEFLLGVATAMDEWLREHGQ